MSASDGAAAPVTAGDLLRWSEALAGIARTGLGFSDNLYERERFEEVLRVAADIQVAAGHGVRPGQAGHSVQATQAGHGVQATQATQPGQGVQATQADHGVQATQATQPGQGVQATQATQAGAGLDSDQLVEHWRGQVGAGVEGYVTPKVAVGAVVGNDRGEILLVQRADSGVWLYPTGWADVGYSASEVAVKEVHEETGMEVEPMRLLAVLDGLRLGFTRIPLYSLVFQCRLVGGELRSHPLECLDAGWFPEDALPEPLAGGNRWATLAFRAIRGESLEVLFDPPREPPWRTTGSGP